MKEIKKYIDIVRYGKRGTENVLKKGDIISITEKIDGANASFRLDSDNPIGVTCYSRNKALNENNRLRGFYDYVLDNIVPIKDKLNSNYVYFGEWLVSHKVSYKEDKYYKFYLFSIYDIEKEKYLEDTIVKSEAKRLNLLTTNYFYEGEFISFEHLMSFVGKSDMTLESNNGEGIVVKNVNYEDRFGKQCFVKLVTEAFAEVQKQKKPKDPNANNPLKELVLSVLTKARVEKMIYKLIDEGVLKENLTIEDMGTILKNINIRIYEDIMKEESDLFINYEPSNIRKMIGKNLPIIIKEILKF